MSYTLAELARAVGGEAVGNGSTVVCGANPPAVAAAGQITLVDSAERLKKLEGKQVAAVVAPRGVECSLPMIVSDDPHAAFTKIVALFRPAYVHPRIGISPRAVVSPTAQVAPDADVHPCAVIGDDVEIASGCVIHSGVQVMAGSKLGSDVVLFPNVVLYENTVVGARTVIHASCVIGAYGFGYKLVDGRHRSTPQLGHVEIGADVEIGAGTTIDRGTYGPTRIGEGTKIDDQVMIGHNCIIGRHNLLCSQVGIAGSCTTGDYVVMAGQVGLADHLEIGHRVMLGAKAGVMHDVPDGSVMLGAPARPKKEQMMQFVMLEKLPEMRKQLKVLEQAVADLERRLDSGESNRSAAA